MWSLLLKFIFEKNKRIVLMSIEDYYRVMIADKIHVREVESR